MHIYRNTNVPQCSLAPSLLSIPAEDGSAPNFLTSYKRANNYEDPIQRGKVRSRLLAVVGFAAPSSRSEVTALMARSIFAFGEEEASSHLSMATLAIPSRNSGYVI